MIIQHTYKIRSGKQRLYAVGPHESTVRAIRATFTDHGMTIHEEDLTTSRAKYSPFNDHGLGIDKKEGNTLTHFPGGWIERGCSAYMRSLAFGASPLNNAFKIGYQFTDNELVTLLEVSLYHTTSFLFDGIVKSRIANFYSALGYEFTITQGALIHADDWAQTLLRHPELGCSPYWPSTEGSD